MNYWNTLDLEGYKAEFGDLIDIITHFANVPRSDIRGLRVPFLQLGGKRLTLRNVLLTVLFTSFPQVTLLSGPSRS